MLQSLPVGRTGSALPCHPESDQQIAVTALSLGTPARAVEPCQFQIVETPAADARRSQRARQAGAPFVQHLSRLQNVEFLVILRSSPKPLTYASW
jgi:hypothetical protein